MMLKKQNAIAVLLAMLLAGNALATQDAVADREADHAALRGLMAKVTQALNDQDLTAVTACFTKKFVFTTVDQSVLTDTLTMTNYYDRMLHRKDSPVTGYKISPKANISTAFLNENCGYCYGTSDDAYTLRRNGRTVHMASRWTATVVKEDGQWKMAAVHTGVDVMDNTVLRVKTLPWWRKCLLAIGIGKYPGEK